MKAPVFLFLIIALFLPSRGFSQAVLRAPEGTGSLTASWDWAMTQSTSGGDEVTAVVWTIDSVGSNWRWDNQGPLLSELLGMPASLGPKAAIVVVLERGEVTLLHAQDLDWPLREDVSGVFYLGSASQSESFRIVSGLRLTESELQRARLYVAAVHRDIPAAGTLIKEALASGNSGTRKAAVHAWGQFGQSEALPRLTAIAVGDGDVEVAKAAAYAIGSVDDAESVHALEAVLDDSTIREVRKAAAYALGNHGSPEARAVLIRLIRTEQ